MSSTRFAALPTRPSASRRIDTELGQHDDRIGPASTRADRSSSAAASSAMRAVRRSSLITSCIVETGWDSYAPDRRRSRSRRAGRYGDGRWRAERDATVAVGPVALVGRGAGRAARRRGDRGTARRPPGGTACSSGTTCGTAPARRSPTRGRPWRRSRSRTERVRIGPLVTPLPRRRTQVVAQQATTIDRLSLGRLTLGLGLGTDGYGEFSAFNEPADDDRRRAHRARPGHRAAAPGARRRTRHRGRRAVADGARSATTAVPDLDRRPPGPDRRTEARASPRPRGIALVGRRHVDRERRHGHDRNGRPDKLGGRPGRWRAPRPRRLLATAGATWAVREVLPGASADTARTIAAREPR